MISVLAATCLAANTSCGDGLTDAPVELPPTPELTLLLVAPDTVESEVGSAVSLSVQVVDTAGVGYPGAVVTWSAHLESGSISSADRSTTDGLGFAGAVWTLGITAGVQHAAATLEGGDTPKEVQFVATGVAGPAVAASLQADTFQLTAHRETALLVTSFEDVFGNEAEEATVTWSTADPTVATIDSTGLVTAVAPGTTTLTVSLAGPTDSIMVIVEPQGAITLTFDDGFRTTYLEAFPILQEYEVQANVAVITEAVGWPDFMTLQQLQQLDAAGWSMVSHSLSHTDLTQLSDSDLDSELRVSQQWLTANHFNGSDIFVVPYHTWDLREVAAIAHYYRAARGLGTIFFQPDSLAQWLPADPYKLTGINADDLPYTTVAGRDRLRGILDRAMNESLFVELFFHRIPPENVAAFREIALILTEYRARLASYHELFAEPRVIR